MTRFLGILAVLAVGAVLQFGVAPHMTILGVRPDFLVILTACMGLLAPPATAAGVGFAAGLMQGAMAGANLAHYITSRSVTGFLSSLVRTTDIAFGVVIAGLVALLATLVAQGLLFFFAPSPNIREFAQDTILVAFYNAILAMPTYSLLRRISKPTKV